MTTISWTSKVWNIVLGCTRDNEECDRCFAMHVAHRGLIEEHRGLTKLRPKGASRPGVDWNGVVRLVPERLLLPFSWRKPRKIFVNSMSDLFHPQVPFEFIAAAFGVMAATPRCFADAPTPEPWSAFFDRIGEGYSTEQARQDYSRQVALTRWERVKDHDYRCPVSTFGLDRQAYIDRCRNGALVPFAIVKDGKWHERGSMGWWGCVSNEMDTDAWNEQVQRLYDDLPDDTMLTIVDCHI